MHDFSSPRSATLGLGARVTFGRYPWVRTLFVVCSRLFGVRHFDTARSYGDGQSEAVLGAALWGFKSPAVVTKIGVPLHSDEPWAAKTPGVKLTQPQRHDSLTRVQQFRVFFPPSSIEHYLRASLSNLRRPQVQGLLLHSIPRQLNLRPYILELRRLQAIGLVQKIGVSVDDGELLSSMDLAWADILQVPFSMVNQVPESNIPNDAEIHVNQIFRSGPNTMTKVLMSQALADRPVVLLQGTRKISRLLSSRRQIAKAFQLMTGEV